MKIIVGVKQVAHIYIQNGYDPNTKDIVRDGLVYILNPYDEVAVEEAIRQREKAGQGEVTVITVGPSRAEEILRWCLALGANEAIHLVDENSKNLDPWSTASILADRIKGLEYDLLLFGKKALDDEMGQVGILVAELLGLPVVTSIAEMDLTGQGKARILRSLERGNREEVLCPLPAVFTVDRALNRPRYPTLPARKAAREKEIRRINLQPLESSAAGPEMVITRLAPPKLRPKKVLAPDSDMSDAERMKFIMTGGLGNKKGGAVAGDPEKIVSGIIDFLKEKKVIRS